MRVDTDIPVPTRGKQFDKYFESLTRYGHSALVPYEDWTTEGKYKLLNRLASRAHYRKVRGLGSFSTGMEATGVRVWRVA